VDLPKNAEDIAYRMTNEAVLVNKERYLRGTTSPSNDTSEIWIAPHHYSRKNRTKATSGRRRTSQDSWYGV